MPGSPTIDTRRPCPHMASSRCWVKSCSSPVRPTKPAMRPPDRNRVLSKPAMRYARGAARVVVAIGISEKRRRRSGAASSLTAMAPAGGASRSSA